MSSAHRLPEIKNVSNIAHSTASDYYVSSLAKSSDGIETPNYHKGAQSRPYVIAAFFVPVSMDAEHDCACHTSLWWAGWATFGLAVSFVAVVSTRSARRPYEIETSLVAVTLPLTQRVSVMPRLTIAPARADFKPLDGHDLRKIENRINRISIFFSKDSFCSEKELSRWLYDCLLRCFGVSSLKEISQDQEVLVMDWLRLAEAEANSMHKRKAYINSQAMKTITSLRIQ